MNKKERFLQAYNYLREKGLVHTQRNVSERMQTSDSNISKAIHGEEKYLTDKFLRRFNRAYNSMFNEEWLIFGEGEMFAPLPTTTISQTSVIGNNNATVSDSAFMEELRQQRELVKTAQEQVNKLIDIIQRMTTSGNTI